MKTKLLKKIRKRYSIVYYPNGLQPSEHYRVPTWPVYYVEGEGRGSFQETKEDCLLWIMKKVRKEYAKYSCKYNRDHYKSIKVWYNK